MWCREHYPTACRICGAKPSGGRGLTLGLCLRHYKYFLRHDPKRRPVILAADHRQSMRRTERRRAARLRAEAMDAKQNIVRFPVERTVFGGWASGACGDDVVGRLWAVPKE